MKASTEDMHLLLGTMAQKLEQVVNIQRELRHQLENRGDARRRNQEQEPTQRGVRHQNRGRSNSPIEINWVCIIQDCKNHKYQDSESSTDGEDLFWQFPEDRQVYRRHQNQEHEQPHDYKMKIMPIFSGKIVLEVFLDWVKS